ncbi:MAG: 50S ribosomal protein L21 [Okeania sp. SIO1I7]|nr:50S ribosomal protein L21 [Okeania sp. SIO1I7]
MSYAIIETGGKQLRVEAGRFYDIDLLQAAEGDQVSLDNVLLVQHEGDVHIGQPLVEGALVKGTVMRHLRGKKIIVYKMRPKKKTRKKRGHRQELTRLMIDSISINGKVLTAVESQTSVTEVTPEASETVTETATEATEIQESVETISEQASETTAEVENVSEEKPENQAE